MAGLFDDLLNDLPTAPAAAGPAPAAAKAVPAPAAATPAPKKSSGLFDDLVGDLPKPAAPEAPKQPRGIADEFFTQLRSSALGGNTKMAGRALEMFGELGDVNAAKAKGAEIAEAGEGMQKGLEPTIPSFTKIPGKDAGDTVYRLAQYLAGGLGQGLGSTAPSLAAGAAGAVLAGGSPVGAVIGFLGASALPSYAQNAAEIYDGLLEEGANDVASGRVRRHELASIAAKVGILSAALDTFGLSKAAGLGGAEARRGLARRIMKGFGEGAGAESWTEAAQEMLSQGAQVAATSGNTPALERLVRIADSGIIGSVTGGAIGGLRGALPARSGAPAAPGATTPPPAAPAAAPPTAPESPPAGGPAPPLSPAGPVPGPAGGASAGGTAPEAIDDATTAAAAAPQQDQEIQAAAVAAGLPAVGTPAMVEVPGEPPARVMVMGYSPGAAGGVEVAELALPTGVTFSVPVAAVKLQPIAAPAAGPAAAPAEAATPPIAPAAPPIAAPLSQPPGTVPGQTGQTPDMSGVSAPSPEADRDAEIDAQIARLNQMAADTRAMAPPAPGYSAPGSPAPSPQEASAPAADAVSVPAGVTNRGVSRGTDRPLSVMDVIARVGIRDDEGHSLRRDLNIRRPGVFRRDGKTIDELGETLWELGYFGPAATTPRPTQTEVLDLIDQASRGKVYTPEAAAQVAEERRARENRALLERRAGELGVDFKRNTTDDELAEAVIDRAIEVALDGGVIPEELAATVEERIAAAETEMERLAIQWEPTLDQERTADGSADIPFTAAEAAATPAVDGGPDGRSDEDPGGAARADGQRDGGSPARKRQARRRRPAEGRADEAAAQERPGEGAQAGEPAAPAPREPAAGEDRPEQAAEGVDAAAFEKLLDDAIAEQGKKAAPAPKAAAPKRKPRAKARLTKTEERGAADIAKSFGLHASAAGAEAVTALYKLFGGGKPGRLTSGIGFDDETYAAAKPHIDAMWREIKAAGGDLAAFARKLVEQFGAEIKPYAMRWFQDQNPKTAGTRVAWKTLREWVSAAHELSSRGASSQAYRQQEAHAAALPAALIEAETDVELLRDLQSRMKYPGQKFGRYGLHLNDEDAHRIRQALNDRLYILVDRPADQRPGARAPAQPEPAPRGIGDNGAPSDDYASLDPNKVIGGLSEKPFFEAVDRDTVILNRMGYAPFTVRRGELVAAHMNHGAWLVGKVTGISPTNKTITVDTIEFAAGQIYEADKDGKAGVTKPFAAKMADIDEATNREAAARRAKPDTAATPAEILSKRGITVTQATARNGKPVWELEGATFEHKDTIKSMGGSFFRHRDTNRAVWSFWNEDAVRKFADYLAGLPVASGKPGAAASADGSGGGAKSDEQVERDARRQREDARPDRDRLGEDDRGLVSAQTEQLIRAGGEKASMPADVIAAQVEDIGLIHRAYRDKKPVFILANAPGTGKTFVLAGAVTEMRRSGQEGFVYVTRSEDLIEQVRGDFERGGFSADGIEFTTYAALSTGNSNVDVHGKVLIFDEAHEVKNTQSARGARAAGMIAAARMVVASSATPFENPVQAEYLAPTGIFDRVGGFQEWAIMYGATVRKFIETNYRTGAKDEVTVVEWHGGRERSKDARAANAWFRKEGVFTQRDKKLSPELVHSTFQRIEASDDYVSLYNRVDESFDRAAREWRDPVTGAIKDAVTFMMVGAMRVQALKRVMEAAKADAIVARIKARLDEGRRVAVFIETKSEREFGTFRKTGDTRGPRYAWPQIEEMIREWEAEVAMARRMGERPPRPPFSDAVVSVAKAFHDLGVRDQLPSVAEQIASALPREIVGEYHGDVSPKKASADKKAFQAGTKRVLIATMAKGGTGLSLHDTVGDKPTVQMTVNLPWSSTQFDQVSGRVARYGLASRAEIDWVFSDNLQLDKDLARRVGGRLRDLGATVRGIEVASAEAMANWDFESNQTASDLVMQTPATEAAKEQAADEGVKASEDPYQLAERLQQLEKGKNRDSSMGYFPTPLPVSMLMTRIAEIGEGDRVLEPSAGTGNLLRFVPAVSMLRAVEVRRDNHADLEKMLAKRENASAKHADFMEWYGVNRDTQYDVILMNPPFERAKGVGYQDALHVQMAHTMLAPGGRLVAIMGEGSFGRADRQSTEFREWLASVGGISVRMPEKAFKDYGTTVRTRLVVIDRSGRTGHTEHTTDDYETLRDIEGLMPSRGARYAMPPGTIPGFFSRVRKVIETQTKTEAPGAFWKQQLQAAVNKGQVSLHELNWTGMMQWLGENDGKILKSDVLEWLDQHGITVTEQEPMIAGGLENEDIHGNEPDEGWSDLSEIQPSEKYIRAEAENFRDAARDELAESADVDPADVSKRAIDRRALELAREWLSEQTPEYESENEPISKDGSVYKLRVSGSDEAGWWWSGENETHGAKGGASGDSYKTYYDAQGDALQWARDHAESLTSPGIVYSSSNNAGGYTGYSLPGGRAHRELLLTLPEHLTPDGKFTNDHWTEYSDGNVIAHMRGAEHTFADGTKGWLWDEMQSDWNRVIREQGTVEENLAREDAAEKKRDAAFDAFYAELSKYPDQREAFDARVETRRGMFKGRTPRTTVNHDTALTIQGGEMSGAALLDKLSEFRLAQRELVQQMERPIVPDMPFRDARWTELTVKRALLWAAQNGYSRMAWVTGQQTQERYNLTKHIDSLSMIDSPGPQSVSSAATLVAKRNGRAVFEKKIGSEDELSQLVGRDAAKRLIGAPASGEHMNLRVRSLSGLDLQMGGEWAANLYDKQIPQLVEKIFKPYGVKAASTQLKSTLSRDYVNAFVSQDGEGQWRVYFPAGAPSQPFDSRDAAVAHLDNMRKHPGTQGPTVHAIDIPQPALDALKADGLPLLATASAAAAPQSQLTRDVLMQVLADAAKIIPTANVKVAMEMERAGVGRIRGIYEPVKQIVALAVAPHMETANPKAAARMTIRHEAVHFLRANNFITPREWQVLADAARRLGWINDPYAQSYKAEPDVMVEEAVAVAFENWSARTNTYEGAIARVFAKLRAFLDRLRNALQGRGFQTADDIFNAIERGDIGRRQQGFREREAMVARAAPADLFAGKTTEKLKNMAGKARDQLVIPGAAHVAVAGPLRAKKEQKSAAALPLFGGAEERTLVDKAAEVAKKDQGELFALFDRHFADRVAAIGEEARGGAATPGNVTVEEPKQSRDLSQLKVPFFIPTALFKPYPLLRRFVQRASLRLNMMERSMQRMRVEYDKAMTGLDEATRADVMTLLLDAEARAQEDEGFSGTFTEAELRENGVSNAVIDAYLGKVENGRRRGGVRRLLDKAGRLVDQHERAMKPFLRNLIKPQLLQSLRAAAGERGIAPEEFDRLMAQRSLARAQARAGEDRTAVMTAIDERLGVDPNPDTEDRLTKLLASLDSIDSRLARGSVRRIRGYVPHKFFGSWGLYKLVPEADGTSRLELVPHPETGFAETRAQALRFARDVAGADPDGQYLVRPTRASFAGANMLQLAQPDYERLMDGIASTFGTSPAETRDALEAGNVRERSMRRWASFKQRREWVAGHSTDINRVFDAHLAEVNRYVALDTLKYEALRIEDRMGLKPQNKSRATLTSAFQAYVRDIMGEKQPLETRIDELFERPWAQPIHVAMASGLAAFTITGGLSANPFVGVLAGSVVGYRMYKARKQAGGFTSRALTGELTSMTAHMKLGAFLNLFTPIVNLMQFYTNGMAVTGYEYGFKGAMRAIKAGMAAATGQDSADLRVLRRHNIAPTSNLSEVDPGLVRREGVLAKLSMFAFNTAERFNRAAVFLGGMQRALDATPAQAAELVADWSKRTGGNQAVNLDPEGRFTWAGAQRYANHLTTRANFDMTAANRPQALRNVFLRVPLQFKNYVVQQLSFVAGLRGKEIAIFAAHLFLVAGLLGLPGADQIDWLVEWLSGHSPKTELLKWAVANAAGNGAFGDFAYFLARGVPAAFGVDISSRAGMGENFLPKLQLTDLLGPMGGSAVRGFQLAEKNATFADQLRNWTPGLGAPAKMLEAAANGMPLSMALTNPTAFWSRLGDGRAVLTSPWKHGAPELDPQKLGTGELALMAVGGTPRAMTALRDTLSIKRDSVDREKADRQKAWDRIGQAYQSYYETDRDRFIGVIRAEQQRLRARGIDLSNQSVREFIAKQRLPRDARELKSAPKAVRRELEGVLR